MTNYERLIEILKQKINIGDNIPVLSGNVESVSENVCSVKLLDSDLIIEDVLLSATEDNSLGIIQIPKVGSNVFVAPLGGDINSLYITKTTELEKVLISIGETNLEVNNQGIKLSKGDINLNKILLEIINIISAIVVVQGKGPDIGKLLNLKTDIQNLIK